MHLLRYSCDLCPGVCLCHVLHLLICICWTFTESLVKVTQSWQLIVFYIFFSSCFLFCWEFFFLIHQGDQVIIFIFCVFILLWYQGNVSFLEWFWKYSFTFSFREQFVKHWCSFFKGWGEFSRNPIWAWICTSCLSHLELIFVGHLS